MFTAPESVCEKAEWDQLKSAFVERGLFLTPIFGYIFKLLIIQLLHVLKCVFSQ